MKELKPRIHENGMDYVLVGDYYVPDLKLPEEHRPIGHWGRLHQSYLKQFRPMVYSDLLLSGKLHTVLADLNEQATDRLNLIIRQMAESEGVTEAMKAENQMLWVQSMNSIRSRAEEIIVGAAVDTITAIITAGVGIQHFQQRNTPPIRRKAVADARRHAAPQLAVYPGAVHTAGSTCHIILGAIRQNRKFIFQLHGSFSSY